MRLLSMLKDGVDGIDLGVVGEAQYALNRADEVVRRPAGHENSYGGWRWECDAAHVARYASTSDILATVAARIASARRMGLVDRLDVETSQ